MNVYDNVFVPAGSGIRVSFRLLWVSLVYLSSNAFENACCFVVVASVRLALPDTVCVEEGVSLACYTISLS